MFPINEFDTDGAIGETAEAAGAQTRGDFLRTTAVGGGVVISAGAIMAALPAMATAAPSKKQDLQILNFALTLEYLEGAFYKEAVESGALTGDVLELARVLNRDEQSHVSALRRTIKSLGGKAVAKPAFDFMGTNKDQTKFLETSFILENTGVRAYLGQAPRIKSKAILAAAGSIVTIEARHSAAIAIQLGRSPFEGKFSIAPNGAFDRSTSMSSILKEVGKTGFIKD